MKITSFDKDNLKTVRQTINSALERAEEELGISLSIGNRVIIIITICT